MADSDFKGPDGAVLSLRTKKILRAVVSEYLTTGEAVGSRTVTRRHGINLSPATVRNVMADLEEMGLLNQPHTSAGRVPTSSGLRFFIDRLLKVRSLSSSEKESLRSRVGGGPNEFDEVMRKTSRALSEFTQYAGVVLAPKQERQTLRHMEFVPLGRHEFLCILVTTDGLIENKIISADVDRGSLSLEKVHNYLNQLLEGLSIEEVRQRVLEELGLEKNRYDSLVSSALTLGKAAVERSRNADIIVSGGANLLDAAQVSDEADVARMKELLKTLEEKEVILRLLDDVMASDRIQVYLGAESEYAPLNDASIIAMPYGSGDKPVGAVAVIGPTRMNYGKIMSVVDFTADLVSMMLNDD